VIGAIAPDAVLLLLHALFIRFAVFSLGATYVATDGRPTAMSKRSRC